MAILERKYKNTHPSILATQPMRCESKIGDGFPVVVRAGETRYDRFYDRVLHTRVASERKSTSKQQIAGTARSQQSDIIGGGHIMQPPLEVALSNQQHLDD